MAKYVCRVCGYLYDPVKGEPKRQTVPGTAFRDLPGDWRCPVCRVGTDRFVESSQYPD
ncbi:MAG: rubredoxin [Firmicutes bacterium]|nr:rubredoxin [Bacillota bacterium]